MKILIVEDEEKLRNSLAEGLRLKGYAIDVAGDGESADEKAFYERYDLIILDLNLPKIQRKNSGGWASAFGTVG